MSMTKINWYPGHMKKTKDLIKDNMQLIDIVLEVVDARIPLSSKNPDITVFAKNKKRVIVLNKSDLVDKKELAYWKKYFKENNFSLFLLLSAQHLEQGLHPFLVALALVVDLFQLLLDLLIGFLDGIACLVHFLGVLLGRFPRHQLQHPA